MQLLIQVTDHERVPERAVHARGAGAHGVFTSYADWSNITGASFLNTPGKETPVFIRFSTVAGSRGSADTVRDVHGFATRFYTDEGNFGKSELRVEFINWCVELCLTRIRYCWQQCSCLLYPSKPHLFEEHSSELNDQGRHQVSRSGSCSQAKAR
jgi:hypothetical protein